jgi:hypothetical protein
MLATAHQKHASLCKIFSRSSLALLSLITRSSLALEHKFTVQAGVFPKLGPVKTKRAWSK